MIFTLLFENKNSKELVLNPSLVFILNNVLTATYDPLYIRISKKNTDENNS